MTGVVDPRTPVSDLDRIAAEFGDLKRRLDELEAPSGTQAFRTVAKLQALVADLQTQVDAAIAQNSYTASTIDAKVQNPPAGSFVTGNRSVSGNDTVGGNLTVTGSVTAPNVYVTDITGTRRTMWVQIDGRMGYASSSADKKTAIRDADEGMLRRLLEVVPKSFVYRAEVERRTQLRIEKGIDYVPARELGLLAQDLHDRGLGAFVIYGEDGMPEGIEYGMLTVALLSINRDLDARLRRIEALPLISVRL